MKKIKVRRAPRPIVAFKDPEYEKLYAFQVTSQIDKKANHKYGYLVDDRKYAGFRKPSIIKCNRENICELESLKILKKIGHLSPKDLHGLLVKLVKVNRMEYRRDREKINQLER